MTNLIQGTAEWHKARHKSFNASEAPVMMGASTKMKRNELLHIKKVGTTPEYSKWVEKNLFDKGHEYESNARKILEAKLGEDLFPTVETKDIEGLTLLASLDGTNMLGDTNFEHKMWNKKLPKAIAEGELPPEYYWQLEHQMLVTGAQRTIFVCSDGTEDNFVQMEYTPVPGRAEALIEGWKQFQEDLEKYEPTNKAEPSVIVETPEALPALRIEINGEVTSSNLNTFKELALERVNKINTVLNTDEDFIKATKDLKWCQEVEKRLEAAKEHALSQTASIDALFKTIDAITVRTREVRLDLNRKVQTEKERRKAEIAAQAKNNFRDFIESLDKELAPYGVRMPQIECDIAGGMYGKRNIDSLINGADTAVSNAKVEARKVHKAMLKNLDTLSKKAKGYEFLFNDKQSYVANDHDSFNELIEARIIKYQAEEKAKEEAQREKIRAEEEAKAKAIAEAERQKIRAQEQANALKEQAQKSKPAKEPEKPAKRFSAIEPPTPSVVSLAKLNELLSPFELTDEIISSFQYRPKKTDGSNQYYHVQDITNLLDDLINNCEYAQEEINNYL